MNGVVVYCTTYGTTKRYAEALAERLGFACMDSKTMSSGGLDGYDVCVYGGGLYVGTVQGLDTAIKAVKAWPELKLFVFTVGLTDPESPEIEASIRGKIQKQMPADRYDEGGIFHLRGGVDWGRLKLSHRTMMAVINQIARKLPESERDESVSAILESYGSAVDYTDLDSLAPIVDCIMQYGCRKA